MAMQIYNNNDGNAAHVFGYKPKGFYQSFFRGRKTACRTKAARGIPIKKRKLESESESESCCARREDDLKRSKRVCTTPTNIAAYSDYEGLGMIGRGSYGVVYKVRHKPTGEIMAMKEDCGGISSTTATQMEMDILKTLTRHPSIVGFNGVADDDYGNSFLVMEYMDTNLLTYTDLNKQKKEGLFSVKKLMKQLLEGVNFLHKNGVMHRDLKPENILINSINGDLKICDFGQSMWFGVRENGSYSPRVGTLWYRAPELLNGVEEYSSEVDMWSVGCIMAELVLNKVLFKGKDEKDQLHEIYCILGHPNNASRISSSISSANLVLSEDGFDLLKGLLTYDTTKRITAEAALNHVWFDDED